MKLSCYYISPKRVLEILDNQELLPYIAAADSFLSVSDNGIHRAAILVAIQKALTSRLEKRPLPTLAELLINDAVAVGSVFTHRGTFSGKGLKAATADRSRSGNAQIWGVVESEGRKIRLTAPISVGDLTTNSAAGSLTGKHDLVLIGLVGGISESEIDIRPIVVAQPVFDIFGPREEQELHFAWRNRMYIPAETVDSFSKMSRVLPPKPEELEELRVFPEAEIKKAFADAIGEPYIPKDWGGEASDLFSARVMLNGRGTLTSFIFKGPAKFRPMTLAELGKNGDQLVRAFNEPCELVVIQHCHQITAPVWEVATALGSRIGREKRFCMIDGAETLRFLRAYKSVQS